MPEKDYDNAPLMMTKFKNGFEEIDFTIPLNTAFDITTPLQAIELEARAKGCAVIIQVGLIPLEEFWGDLTEEDEGDSADE